MSTELSKETKRALWNDSIRMCRINNLRMGLELVIEKAKYDEYGTFEDVCNRIVGLCEEVLAEDALEALKMKD